jgi:hypothetical protein
VLHGVKCGTEYRFRRSDLETWIANQLSRGSRPTPQTPH